MRKTCQSLVSLNFEIENNISRKDEAANYHCAKFVYNLLVNHECPLLERIGLRFDFIIRASKNRFFDLLSIPDLFPNLKQIELLNVTYTFANKFELS